MREPQQKFSNAFYAFIQAATKILSLLHARCVLLSVLWSLVKEDSRINNTRNKMNPSSSF